MTIDVMRSLGVELLETGRPTLHRAVLPALSARRARHRSPDASAATYFWATAAITGGRVRVNGLTRRSRQGDARFVDVLGRMGCLVHEGGVVAGGRRAQERTPGRHRRRSQRHARHRSDAGRRRPVCEWTDRHPQRRQSAGERDGSQLPPWRRNSRGWARSVEVSADGLTIHPPERISPAEIRTYDDHRNGHELRDCRARRGRHRR